MTHRSTLFLAGVFAVSSLASKAADPTFPILIETPTAFPCGKTLVIPLVADDADGDPLSFTVTSSNPQFMARVRTGNFHYKMHVHTDDDGSVVGTPTPYDGDMEFQLFRNATPETAAFIAGFAQSGYYDNVKIHRIIPDFIIQGGDPAGTGGGDSPYTIRHEFRPHLIYTGRGQLAMANSQGGYDQEFKNNGNFQYRTGTFTPTNGSQFFVTLGQPRHLDFKHTLFGQLVRGFSTLDKVESVSVDEDGPDNTAGNGDDDRPFTPVLMTQHAVTASKTDGVLLVSATTTGAAILTVTARDPQGGTVQRTIPVASVVDTINDPPMLLPFEPQVVPAGGIPNIRINAFDLEHDAISSRFPVQNIFDSGNIIYAGVNPGNLRAVSRPTPGFWDITIGVAGLNDPLLDIDPFSASRFEMLEVGVGDKVVMATPRTVEATAATETPTMVLASFRHGSAGASPDDFIVDVNWGDRSVPQNNQGSSAPITVVRSATEPGTFEVRAKHTYPRPGLYPLHVTIDGPMGSTDTARGWGVVSATDAVLRATGEDIKFRGATFSGRPVAYFRDNTPGAKPTNYTVFVDWGDGQRTPGTVRQVAQDRFAVFGTHRYQDAETFSVAVHIRRTGPDAETVAWSTITATGFEGPQYQPPFSKANITALWSEDPHKIYRKISSTVTVADINATLFLLNGGDKPTGKWKLKFWLSPNNTLDPTDTLLKVGPLNKLLSEIKLGSLAPGAGGNLGLVKFQGGDFTIRLPGLETGAGKYVIAQIDYSDPITDKMKVAKTIPFGPLTGILVSPTSVSLREDAVDNGHKKKFRVKLDTAPTANVTIPLDITQNGVVNTTRATLDKAELVFTPTNWNIEQEVEVTALDDLIQNSSNSLTIRLKAATSTDLRFNDMNGRDVGLGISDNPRNVVVTPLTLTAKEGNAAQTFMVKLQTAPSADVTVPLDIVNAEGNPDTTRATLDKVQLIFTPANGTTEQTVTVSAVNDDVVNGNGTYKIRVKPAQSAGGATGTYHNRDGADIALTVQDNDVPGISVTPTAITAVEGGTAVTFLVKLDTQPSAEVTIPLELVDTNGTPDASRATLDVSQLVFTTENGTTSQTVTITAIDDALVNGNAAFKILLKPAISADGNTNSYHNRDGEDVNLTVQDNDTP
jgi:cyclophilin family peptidyl-prolyl cis-trans isomerase